MDWRAGTVARRTPLRRRARLWLAMAAAAAAVAACACGDKQPRAQSPRSEGVTPPSQGDAGVLSAGDRTTDSKLTAAECDGLVDHVLAIAARRFRAEAAQKGDPIPTEAQLQKIRATLQSELGAPCRRMQRQDFECAMSAEDPTALEACQAAEQPVDQPVEN